MTVLPETQAPLPTTVDLYSFTQDELKKYLVDHHGVQAYRGTQVFEWLHKRRVYQIEQMTDLPQPLRAALQAACHIPVPSIEKRMISVDGTRKYLFRTLQGNLVESVMIKQPNRMTLCVSSQVGCGMGCAFCRTGTMGFMKHLHASEILQQVHGVLEDAKQFGDSFSNIVFMGMGEPLHNFDHVCQALRVLRDQKGFDFSGRKITISSVGLVPAIERFGQTGIDVNLAISLNATSDEVRSEIMPINQRFPIATLMETLHRYPLKNRRKITIEYVMLGGVNDTPADMKRLAELLKGLECKVNLIPYNSNAGLGFDPPARETISAFVDYLVKRKIDTTIRWSKGQDIQAACGQLAVAATKKKGVVTYQVEGPSIHPEAAQQLAL